MVSFAAKAPIVAIAATTGNKTAPTTHLPFQRSEELLPGSVRFILNNDGVPFMEQFLDLSD